MPVCLLSGKRSALMEGGGALVAPGAHVMGDVHLGARGDAWFGAVICSDNEPIVIGDETNIQDGAVLGRNCLVGAGALVTEGKAFLDGSLIVGPPERLVRELDPARAHGPRCARRRLCRQRSALRGGI